MKTKFFLLSISGLILSACSGDNSSDSNNQELVAAQSEIEDLKSQLSEANTKISTLEEENEEMVAYVEEYLDEWENSLEEAPSETSMIVLDNLREFPLGETIIFDTGHEVTVNDIYITSEDPNPSDTIQNNFVRVDFAFKNGESDSLTIGGDNVVKLYDSNGVQAKMTSKNFLFQEVESGEEIETSVYYDADQAPYYVVVGDSSWKSE